MKTFETESVAINSLQPHPRNYRKHPDDQLEHIIESIKEYGFYRNIVVSKDNYILAGHGVVQAAKKMRRKEVPIVRVDLDADEPRALKLLAADNELSLLAEIDDRALSEILKEIKDEDVEGLLGTGYTDQMLANLLMITRPASEIADMDAAAEWVGMPEYEVGEKRINLTVNFETTDDRKDFAELLGAVITDKTRYIWFPVKEKDDVSSVRFEPDELE